MGGPNLGTRTLEKAGNPSPRWKNGPTIKKPYPAGPPEADSGPPFPTHPILEAACP